MARAVGCAAQKAVFTFVQETGCEEWEIECTRLVAEYGKEEKRSEAMRTVFYCL